MRRNIYWWSWWRWWYVYIWSPFSWGKVKGEEANCKEEEQREVGWFDSPWESHSHSHTMLNIITPWSPFNYPIYHHPPTFSLSLSPYEVTNIYIANKINFGVSPSLYIINISIIIIIIKEEIMICNVRREMKLHSNNILVPVGLMGKIWFWWGLWKLKLFVCLLDEWIHSIHTC